MKTFLVLTAGLFIFGGFFPAADVFAGDGAVLFEKLTCHSCHGPEGRGMVRTETKEKYHLKRKEMYREMVREGMPVETVRELIPLYEQKFEDKPEFVKAIEALIGKEDTEKFIDIITAIGGRVYWRKGDLIPGFEDYPRHAGNKKIYLYNQMKDILEGRRTNGKTEAMRGIRPYIDSNKITDEDYMSIAEYLSNVKIDE